jgi:hypothetical protein
LLVADDVQGDVSFRLRDRPADDHRGEQLLVEGSRGQGIELGAEAGSSAIYALRARLGA